MLPFAPPILPPILRAHPRLPGRVGAPARFPGDRGDRPQRRGRGDRPQQRPGGAALRRAGAGGLQGRHRQRRGRGDAEPRALREGGGRRRFVLANKLLSDKREQSLTYIRGLRRAGPHRGGRARLVARARQPDARPDRAGARVEAPPRLDEQPPLLVEAQVPLQPPRQAAERLQQFRRLALHLSDIVVGPSSPGPAARAAATVRLCCIPSARCFARLLAASPSSMTTRF